MEQIGVCGLAELKGNPLSFLAVIMAAFLLNIVIRFQNYCAQFHCLLTNNNTQAGEVRGNEDKFHERERPREKLLQRTDHDGVNLSKDEVRMVMERLGIFGSIYGPEGDRCKASESIGVGEISKLFEEEEVRLDEIKEAFYVFDENCDGFIDAEELSGVLGALGILHAEESECRELIRNFDENGDGFIDFREFTKLVEKSFR